MVIFKYMIQNTPEKNYFSIVLALGGSLYSCAEFKKRKRLQEQKGLAAKVRESFRREERQTTPYSGEKY